MPGNDTNLLIIILAHLQQNYDAIAGFFMAFLMSMLRAWFLQQKSSYRQRILDGAICGSITLSSVSVLNHFGMSSNLSTFIGAMVGFIGAEKIREFLFSFIKTRVRNDNHFNQE
ncbi:phage holin, lambda family [Pasteurella bettyae]|uniref:phage holin, lambda family n=1 Tax=Pasteurella bettyae TaxID=752 RepID=UPI003D2DB35D